jgi:geranylgeranyl diphosphate synthase, type II
MSSATTSGAPPSDEPRTATDVAADTDTDFVESMLDHYSAIARTQMERWLPDGEPSEPLWDLVRDYPSRSGKGIRPALLMATCEAFGGTIAQSVGPATALELLHNAFLVHDDVEDGSRLRRGEPTLHERHGMPLAVNAGDALALVALLPLREQREIGSRLQRRVVDEFVRMGRLTVEGQAVELRWRDTDARHLVPEDYLELIWRKTCWYTTICPLRVGAIIGTRDRAPLRELNRLGFHLGVAFQIRDDLLNLVDWNERFGKARLDDLREGKRTLMLIHLVGRVEGADAAFVESFLRLAPDDRDDEALERLLELMVAHGSIEFAEDYARGIADAALDAYDSAFAGASSGDASRFVRGLVPYMLERRH